MSAVGSGASPRNQRTGVEHSKTKQATATIEHKAWTEEPFAEAESGPKLTRASVVFAYTGEIAGEGTLEYLMTYVREDSVPYLGLERVVGRIGDRTGGVVWHDGVFADKAAKATVTVVEGSATGDLVGLSGTGRFVWAEGEGQSGTLMLDYAIG